MIARRVVPLLLFALAGLFSHADSPQAWNGYQTQLHDRSSYPLGQHLLHLPIIFTPPSPIARIEITPQSVLLTGRGATRSLVAQAYDHQGNSYKTRFTWASSHPELVNVSSDGTITALADLGSAQITVTAEGITSIPAFVVIAEPAAGAHLVRDDQVLAGPELLESDVSPTLGTRYRIVLSGTSAPAPGSILLASESLPIAGRVVTTNRVGNNTEVILELVPLTQLFRNLRINERFDLRHAEVVLDESFGPDVNVTRNAAGNLLLSFDSAAMEVIRETETGTEFRLGPFTCEASVGLPAVSGNLIEIELIREIDLDFVIDINEGTLDRLLIKLDGSVTTRMSGGITLTAAFEGSFKCRAIAYTIVVPIGGPVSVFISPVLPLGMGFDLEGEFPLAEVEIRLLGESSISMAFGFDYSKGEFTGFKDLEVANQATPVFNLPDLSPGLRFIGSTSFYGFVELGVGVLPHFRLGFLGLDTTLSIIEVTFGPRLSVDLATRLTQVLDDDYASTYDLSLHGKGSLGSDLAEMFELLSGSIKVFELSETLDIILAESPTDDFVANRVSVVPEQPINFTLDLEPANLDFPVIGYNVAGVSIYRFRENALELMVDLPAGDGQEQFTWTWMPAKSDVGESTFVAFVETNGIPAVSLEMATITLDAADRVSTGTGFSCAVEKGDLFCWGVNSDMQLGTASSDECWVGNPFGIPCSTAPIRVRADSLKFRAVSAGGGQGCAISVDNDGYCWGLNLFGRGGILDGRIGTLADRIIPSPTPVFGGIKFKAISAGGSHTCGIDLNGKAYCWGNNGDGQLGTVTDFCWENASGTGLVELPCSTSPVQVTSNITFKAISAGGWHTCGISIDNEAYCWGWNGWGQLGISLVPTCGDPGNPYQCSHSPVFIGHYQRISTGALHTCAITESNQAFCWGNNGDGQLGRGTVDDGGYSQQPVVGDLLFAHIDTGNGGGHDRTFTCGTTLDGTSYCWGLATMGRLGNGIDEFNTIFSQPTLVSTNSKYSRISAGVGHSCAITVRGTIECWGENHLGQVGNVTGETCREDGLIACSTTPVHVPVP